MTKQPLVSVIIPTYNRAAVVGQTIDNVFEQTYRHIEIIVVDDGSTDHTHSVLKSYGNRIRWTSQKNAGPGVARNRGIAMAQGEIVAFQDSDDSWDSTKIARQVSLLERVGSSVPCCLCNTNIYSTNGRVINSFDHAPVDPPYEEGIWANVAEILTTRFILFNQAVAIRRAVLQRIGGFDESIPFLEDYEFPLRLALEGPWAFIRTPLVMQKQGSSFSWSRKAFEDPVFLGECDVSLRRDILRRLLQGGGDPQLRSLMEKHLKRAERGLTGVKLQRSTSQLSRFLGTFYFQFGKLQSAVDRRLPGYPKMKARPVSEFCG